MLTPLDIHEKEFGRSFRGYDEDEIDDFLDEVTNDYESLFRENAALKDEVKHLKQQIAQNTQEMDRYKSMEKTLQDTLIMAQKTAEEVTKNAQDASMTLKANARRDCENMVQETKKALERKMSEVEQHVKQAATEYDRLVKEKYHFFEQLRVSLLSELSTVEANLAQLPQPEQDAMESDIPSEHVDIQKKEDASMQNGDQAEALRIRRQEAQANQADTQAKAEV